MAIATYPELKTEIVDYLARSDLDAKIPTFVRLLEARINRIIRDNGNEFVTTLTPDVNGQVTLPDDYYQYRNVNAVDNGPDLEYITPSAADARYGDTSASRPSAFTIIGRTLFVYPMSQTPIVLSYYRGVSGLSDLVQANWLLLRHPDVYLFGTLSEASAYIQDDARVSLWEGKLQGAIEDMRYADRSARWGKARSQLVGGVPC